MTDIPTLPDTLTVDGVFIDLRGATIAGASESLPPIWKVHLRAGDVVYIPDRHLRAAEGTGSDR